MKIFLDTAILEEIELAKSYGLLDGVTTNPSLMKKAVEALKKKGEKIDLDSYIKKILITARGKPVSLEVTAATHKEMVAEGKVLYKKFNPVANNVVIKIPVNPGFEFGAKTSFDGLKAIKELSKAGIPINCTLIFTPEQALLAAKAGARYISPFAGRIDDLLRTKAEIKFEKSDYYPSFGWQKDSHTIEDNGIISGVHLIEQCIEILEIYDIHAEIIGASIRNPRQTREIALRGCHIATLPFNVLQQCADHELTIAGMKLFTADAVKEYAEITQYTKKSAAPKLAKKEIKKKK